MTITYVDTGVLIAAFKGKGDVSARAMAILDDPNREFASSFFVKLELLPKAIHFKNFEEEQFYNAFFDTVKVWAKVDDDLLKLALAHAQNDGLNGMDALHIAAAVKAEAVEIVTTEKKAKSIHRSKAILVSTIQ